MTFPMPSSTAVERAGPQSLSVSVSGSSGRCRRAALAAVALVVVTAGGAAQATADGPDHYRVRGVSPGRHVTLRAEPSTASAPLARLPSNATCLRSFGCQGGLSFEEFGTLSEEDKRRRAAEDPRWCKIDYRGTVGWLAGRYLAEDACSPATTPGQFR
jgi:hypothetical protein